MSNDKYLMVGAGYDGPALYIDSDFNKSRSCRCATYNNKKLNGESSKSDFMCLTVEVILFK
jgi:hypothetical protein